MIRGTDSDEYVQLLRTFPPRVIHHEAQLEATEERIGELLALPERTPAQEQYLDLLSTLAHQWESAHIEFPRVSGVEMVKFLCDMHGIPQRALVPFFGTPSIVSEVLSGKRELQRKHIERLAAFFHVSPAVFFPAVARDEQAVA